MNDRTLGSVPKLTMSEETEQEWVWDVVRQQWCHYTVKEQRDKNKKRKKISKSKK